MGVGAAGLEVIARKKQGQQRISIKLKWNSV